MIRTARGALVEYSLRGQPLALSFEFNPETLTRSRSVQFDPGSVPIMDFTSPADANRIAQAASAKAETIGFDILLDATDRLSDPTVAGHRVARESGVEPEIATLRAMLEPRVSGGEGFVSLVNLGRGEVLAHDRSEHLSVLLFIWGPQVLPVFMTSLSVQEQAHLPNLRPYRAKVTVALQVLESNNPYYRAAQAQRARLAASNTHRFDGALGGEG